MLMVKNRNGISLSHYQRPVILPNTERFVGEEVKPQKKHEVTTAKCDLSPPSLTSTTQLRVWIFPLHPQRGIGKRTCTCQINWITARDGPQSTGRWQTSKISLIPHRSTPCCCTHLISGTWIICAWCLHTHTLHAHAFKRHNLKKFSSRATETTTGGGRDKVICFKGYTWKRNFPTSI